YIVYVDVFSSRHTGMVLALYAFAVQAQSGPSLKTSWSFDFTKEVPVYSAQSGFGYEPGFPPGDKPFFFSVEVPEGNYRVTVKVGAAGRAGDNTVFAELRRLVLEDVHTGAGQFETRSFLVNVRRPAIAGGGAVRLNDRERTTETWAWDNRLT